MKSFAKKAEKHPMKETELSCFVPPTKRNRRSLGLCSRVRFIVVAKPNIDIKGCYSQCKNCILYLKQCKKNNKFSSFTDFLQGWHCLPESHLPWITSHDQGAWPYKPPVFWQGMSCMSCPVTAAWTYNSKRRTPVHVGQSHLADPYRPSNSTLKLEVPLGKGLSSVQRKNEKKTTHRHQRVSWYSSSWCWLSSSNFYWSHHQVSHIYHTWDYENRVLAVFPLSILFS